ncbi:ArsR/SmtB family transcription factor [Rhizobium grahamii]|uniref:ArsR family transcriptional regulator n=2 Tax=Rhizobium grahamii TaxID=1120045 RepID=S3H7I9_9HYPH|nr:metalloregulator ArsR/SmtB family transcription factor [Rhizobium grahamii]EPE94609.1 ArsR family transcriptional regulator [Rhizobium grahamii CCGE 502]RDJ06126.1 transcriptional regulator [Rhizobium grahamii]
MPDQATVDRFRVHDAAHYLRNMSHQTRLRIVCVLAGGERSVGELQDALDMPQAAVSQQLAKLRSGGIVTERRTGRQVYYRVIHSETIDLLQMLSGMFPAGDRGRS